MPGPPTLAFDDLDSNGGADLLITNVNAHNILVLLNNGAAIFGDGAFYGTGQRPLSISSGDFDADGDRDVAVATQSDGIFLLFNRRVA